MANLNKTNSGLLFFDDFSERTLMWTLSPSDANCLSFGDAGLKISRTRRYVTYTIVEPSTEDYSCIIKLDHIPANVDDIAGIVVMSTTREYAECQSYLATGPSEMGNSQDVFVDIENMVKDILAEDYVQWEDVSDTETPVIPEEGGAVIIPTEGFVDEIYQYIKFTKTKYKYIFWASKDGLVWIEIGNVKFDNSGVIGFFLYGTTDEALLAQDNHCFFESFALYSSKYITIEGVDRQYEMEMRDENGNILLRTDNIQYAHMLSRSNKICVINTATMPTPIKNATLRVYSRSNYAVTINEFPLGESIYGGDSFTLESNIELFINNIKINQSEIYELGQFYRGSYFIKLDIRNSEGYMLHDVKVKVIRYSEYYGGEEEVYLAAHADGIVPENLMYEKEIIISRISPSEGQSVYLKLLDKPVQDFYMTANAYRFKIVIE